MNIKAIKLNIDQTKHGYNEETTLTFYNDNEQLQDEKEHIQEIIIDKLKQLKSFDEPSKTAVTLSILNEFYSFQELHRFTFDYYDFCKENDSPFLRMDNRPYNKSGDCFEIESSEKLMIDSKKNFNREKTRLIKLFVGKVLNTFENKINEMERV